MTVGYDSAGESNSWGADRGKKGYFTIPYAYLADRNLSDDFWTIRASEEDDSALLRPSVKGRSSSDNGISKIFAGSAAIIGNQCAAGSAHWKDATVFSAHKLAADVQFVDLLNLELPLRLCHESRIAQRGEKENAKPQQSVS
jgi:hypothetical protein